MVLVFIAYMGVFVLGGRDRVDCVDCVRGGKSGEKKKKSFLTQRTQSMPEGGARVHCWCGCVCFGWV